MAWIVLQHTIVTAVLIGVVTLVCRLVRPSAAIRHGLWAVVLLKFMIPPLVFWPWAVDDVAQLVGVRPRAAGNQQAGFESATSQNPQRHTAGHRADGSYFLAEAPQRVDVDRWPGSPPGFDSPLPASGSGPVTDLGIEERSTESRGSVLLFGLFLGVWIVGAIACVAWNARKIVRLARLVSHGSRGPNWLRNRVSHLSAELGIRVPRLVVSNRVHSPFVWGLPGLTLVWPAALATRPSQDVDCILIHELAHVRRRDHWVAWLDLLAKIVWWWNPCAWFARRKLNDAAELACDAWVVRMLPDQRRVYAEALVTVCQSASERSFPVPAIGARTGTRRAFERRLVMIMCDQVSSSHGRWVWLFVGTFLLIALPGFALATRDHDDNKVDNQPPAAEPADTDASASESDTVTKDTVTKDTVTKDTVTKDTVTKDTEQEPISWRALVAAAAVVQSGDESSPPSASDLKVLSEVIEKLVGDRATGVDKEKLIQAAIQGMLQQVDENAAYLSPDDLEQFHHAVNLVGVGIVLEMSDNNVTVRYALPSSPAYKKKVQPGDVIEQIDGKPVDTLPGTPLAAAVKLIRGEPGKAVTLGIRRQDSDELEQIKIVRAAIKIDTVNGYERDDRGGWKFVLGEHPKIGYVHLTRFGTSTAQDLKSVVRDLESQAIGALVLDLRDCPGGLLQEAVEAADTFVGEGLIARIDGVQNATENRVFRAHKDGTNKQMQLAVLINQNTASAAEILAACLKDNHRAVLVGQRTYGRGVVQSIVPLKAGGGALRLTAAKIVRANGNYIHRFADADESGDWGVQPTDGCNVPIPETQMKQLQQDRRVREFPSAAAGAGAVSTDDPQLLKAVAELQAKLK